MKSMFEKTTIFLSFYKIAGSNYIGSLDSDDCNRLYSALYSITPSLHYSIPLQVSN
jgi:hypothetical protein